MLLYQRPHQHLQVTLTVSFVTLHLYVGTFAAKDHVMLLYQRPHQNKEVPLTVSFVTLHLYVGTCCQIP